MEIPLFGRKHSLASSLTPEPTRRQERAAHKPPLCKPADTTISIVDSDDVLAEKLRGASGCQDVIDGKPGMIISGGNIVGISTQLWSIKDATWTEVAIAGSEYEAERIRVIMTNGSRVDRSGVDLSIQASTGNDGFDFTKTLEWDGIQALDTEKLVYKHCKDDAPWIAKRHEQGSKTFKTKWPCCQSHCTTCTATNETLEVCACPWVKKSEASDMPHRSDREKQLAHVHDAFDAIATAAEDSQGFLISDVFTFLKVNETSKTLEEKLLLAETSHPPAIILKALRQHANITIVLIVDESMSIHADLIREKMHWARRVVVVGIDRYNEMWMQRNQIQQRMLAILTADPDTKSAYFLRKSAAVNVVCGGGAGVLQQMATCCKYNIPIIVLNGTERIADIWSNVWSERSSTLFDPMLHSKQLSVAFGYAAPHQSVAHVREILNSGELIMHEVANNSAVLQRICTQQLQGDELMALAMAQIEALSATSASYRLPRWCLKTLSQVLAFSTTVLALLVDEEAHGLSSPLAWVVLTLPALLFIIDQMFAYMHTEVAEQATSRGAGLTEQHLFRYCTRTGLYADSALNRYAESQNIMESLVTTILTMLTICTIDLLNILNILNILTILNILNILTILICQSFSTKTHSTRSTCHTPHTILNIEGDHATRKVCEDT
jgi:hypothetical protein